MDLFVYHEGNFGRMPCRPPDQGMDGLNVMDAYLFSLGCPNNVKKRAGIKQQHRGVSGFKAGDEVVARKSGHEDSS